MYVVTNMNEEILKAYEYRDDAELGAIEFYFLTGGIPCWVEKI